MRRPSDWPPRSIKELDAQALSTIIGARRRPITPLPSAGFRVGDLFAYCTDTEFDPETIRQVAGVTTLLHEAWEPDAVERGHTSGEEAGIIAAEAGVSRLLITHNHPLSDVAERTAAAAQARFDATLPAADGAILGL